MPGTTKPKKSTPKRTKNQGPTSPSAKKKKSTAKSSELLGMNSTEIAPQHDEIGRRMYDIYYQGQKSGDLKELLDQLGPTEWPGKANVVLSSDAMIDLRRYEAALAMLKNPIYSNTPGMAEILEREKEFIHTFLRDVQRKIDELGEQSESSEEESSYSRHDVSSSGMVTKVAKTTGRAAKSSRLMSNLTNSLPSSFPNCFLPFVDHEKKGRIHSNTLIEYFLSTNDALKTSCKTGFRFWNPITEEFWDMRGRYDQQQIDSFLY